MIKISDILEKKVLSLSSAQSLGIIKDVHCINMLKNVNYLEVYNEKLERSFLLSFGAVKNFSDVILVEDESVLINIEEVNIATHITKVLGMAIYSQYGDYKGNIVDIECCQNSKVYKIHSNDFAFTPTAISLVGDVILIRSNTKLTKKKPLTLPRPKIDYPVYLLDDQPQSIVSNNENIVDAISDSSFKSVLPSIANAMDIPKLTLSSAPQAISVQEGEPMISQNALKNLAGELYDAEEHIPTRIICNYDFLIGRTLFKDLYSFNGNLIAKSGIKIDDVLLTNARRAGKLVELTLNSKRY